MTDDPYATLDTETNQHVFWAETVADRVEDRFERTDATEPLVVRGAVSPSGVPHLGHANELLRGYFVAEVLRERRAARSEGEPPNERTGNGATRERGYAVEQLFTSDDRDPLRKVPRTLADLDWNVVDLGDVPNPGVLGRNLGHPLTDVPDPFECCDSFGDHQTTLLQSMVERLDIPVEIRSTTAMYEDGLFDSAITELLENRDRAHDVLGEYQDSVRETDEYVPFNPICEHCGKITDTVTGVDIEAGTVEYVCTDLEAGNRVIEGCGHAGTAMIREGKLPWRFEWPAQWRALGVDFEPFGKDHAEGSWPSGVAIARELLDFSPPTPMVYEWFTLNGEPLSSSSGHVVTVPEVLELVEPAVLRYFFAKNPRRARDFDVSQLDQLVDEFDRFEGITFDVPAVGDVDEAEKRRAERVYPLVVDAVPDERPIRLPYTFAAVLGMTDDTELRETMARREGHLGDEASEQAVEDALDRVNRARRWAERTDNAYNYRLEDDLPDVAFEGDIAAALDDLADVVADDADGERIQSEIFETARAHDRSPGDLFTAGYRLFFGTEQGPKLGPFLAELDREFVVRRLRREG